MKLSAPLRAVAYMTASSALFSMMNLSARFAAHEGVHFTMVALIRALLGASVAYCVARANGHTLRVGDKRRMALRSALGTLAMLFTFAALAARGLHLGDVVTLFNLAPVFIALLAPIWLREPAGRSIWLSLVLALGGVVLVLRPSCLFSADVHSAIASAPPVLPGALPAASDLFSQPWFGAFCAVGAACASACAMMMLRQIGQTETAESIAVHFGASASVVFALLALPFLSVPSPRAALALLVTGLCGGFAQLAMTRAYGLEKAARVSSMGYVAVPISALLGIAFLGDSPQITLWFGMFAVVLAGALTTWRSLREARI